LCVSASKPALKRNIFGGTFFGALKRSSPC
jgi:hypothetical protein